MTYDLLIKDGSIVDGSGSPGFRGNVAVKDGRIVEVGAVSGPARRVIDASGLVVSPGFIDIHTHFDAQVLWDPLLTPSSWHGVTTVVMGNCGFTLAPCKPQDREYLTTMLARVEGMSLDSLRAGLPWDWSSVGEYLSRIGGRLGINVSCLVGHSSLRYYVMGESSLERAATEEEVARMQALLRESMEAGAAGFSSSRARTHVDWHGRPVPSRQAAYAEVYALAQVLGEVGAGIIEITPGSLPAIDAAEREWMTKVSADSGRVLVWNELYQSRANPTAWKDVLQFLVQARNAGASIYGMCLCLPSDQFFDLLDNTLIMLPFEGWKQSLALPLESRLRSFSDPRGRAQLLAQLQQGWVASTAPNRWDMVKVANPRLPKNQGWKGMSLRQMAEAQGKGPLDAMLDLAVEERLDTEFAVIAGRNNEPDSVREILKSPVTVTGLSDAGAHVNMVSGAEYSTYLLSHWVRELGDISLEEAIRKLTSMPAGLLGFSDRGLVQAGKAADLCVFDRDAVRPGRKYKVNDLPGGAPRIVVEAEGMRYVIVNGEVLLENGGHCGAYPGRVLKGARTAGTRR